MPSNPISIDQISQLITSDDTIADPRIFEFVQIVDRMATQILQNKSDEYLFTATHLIEASVMASMTKDGLYDMDEFLSLMIDPRLELLIGLAFKMAVGLAALEELR